MSSDSTMPCPCCGMKIELGVQGCPCGARFVGDPMEPEPYRVPALGFPIIAIALFLVVLAGVLLIEKWLALALLLVVWLARRGMKQAREAPELFGGFRMTLGTLVVASLTGVVVSIYGLSTVPEFLESRQIRKEAQLQAVMRNVAYRLEIHLQTYGSYPPNAQVYKKLTDDVLLPEEWKRDLSYQSFTEAIAGLPVGVPGMSFNNYELRAAGPDGRLGTEDDIVMRDGVFVSGAEALKQKFVTESIDH